MIKNICCEKPLGFIWVPPLDHLLNLQRLLGYQNNTCEVLVKLTVPLPVTAASNNQGTDKRNFTHLRYENFLKNAKAALKILGKTARIY